MVVRLLRKALPRESVIDDPLRLALYGYDGTFYEGEPEVAILPENTEQVVAAVKACREARVPIVPRGAATSLSGGPVPISGGAVFSFSRMDRMVELDYANQRAVVEPGVVNLQLHNVLIRDGYFYAPDPASQCVCTLGGNVGENSGGPHCLKYGVTANHVLGLETVLPDGDVLITGGKPLDAPGYDLTGLIVGSEGTFGLVTKIICRVQPLPESVVTMLAIFDSLNAASRTVADIIADGILPATLEMMDKAMIQAVETALHAGYPTDAEAVLLIELDGLKSGLRGQVSEVEKICRGNGATSFQVAEDEAQRTLLWKGRKGAFGAVVNIAPSKICTDISVPRGELPKVLAEVMEISRKWDIPITNVFHAGDGNLHPLILFDPRDAAQLDRAKSADQEITQLALAHGGVLTGEHGIGCGKRKYMRQMFGDSELRLMWRIKDVFDPEGLCNPEKVLPDSDEIPAPEPLAVSEGALGEGVIRAENEDQVRDVLARADRDRRKVVIRGAGTKSGAIRDDVITLDLSGLNRIVAHDQENLTVTVQCGVTLRELNEALTEHGQMIPSIPRAADKATLGGIVAANDFGPHRQLYGAGRDFAIGVRAALPGGEVVRFGGSCVKNVAGYAVERLLVGSHGSLGAMTELTLRTLPRPEVRRSAAVAVEGPIGASAFLSEVVGSRLRPAAIELLNPAASASIGRLDSWHVALAVEGFADDVEDATRRLAEMASRHGLGDWFEPAGEYVELWSSIADVHAGSAVLKVSCPVSETASLAGRLDRLDGVTAVRASAGLGLIFRAGTAEIEARASELARGAGGWVSWLPPYPGRTATSPQGKALDLCRRLKAAFDPNGILT